MSDERAQSDQHAGRWAEHLAELRQALHDRMVDHDRVFIALDDRRCGRPCLEIADAIEVAIDYFTDGDHASFFNRCPACDCLCSGDANIKDCGCWCHHPDEGWQVWQERVHDLETLLGLLTEAPDA